MWFMETIPERGQTACLMKNIFFQNEGRMEAVCPRSGMVSVYERGKHQANVTISRSVLAILQLLAVLAKLFDVHNFRCAQGF